MSCQPRILDEIFLRKTDVSTDKDPCHDHKSDGDNDHDHGYVQDDYFVQVLHAHNDVHHLDHE